ncbi:MAG: aminotransferase class IV [Gemmatimonadota bacterium]
MIVYLNGEFLPVERTGISIDDPAFTLGEGVYETVLVRKGRLPFWEDHWRRLCASADALDLEVPLTFAAATRVLEELALRNDLPDALARIQLSGAGLPPWPSAPGNGRPARGPRPPRSVLVRLAALPRVTADEVLLGWKIVLSRLPYAPFLPQVKHTSRLANVLARREAERAGAQEAILLDGRGVLLEGTRSSVFFLRDEVLYTPALECGILSGVTRERLLQAARREGFTVNEGVHLRHELEQAEEVFLTFTSAGVMPVTDVEGRPVGNGRMGRATRALRLAYERVLANALARAPAPV